ncbi:MAG TPA: tetratricopeptide repeat protein [Steroidobacteraceae bacterium]|nr:tetratricopeptide repeat protein [Steroidobacteraceae bacterium]
MTERTIEETLEQIGALVERRRTAQARALIGDAIKQFPEDTRLLLQAAWVDYLDDKSEAAMASVRQILAREPDNGEAKQLLFELLVEREDLVEAERVVIDLLRVNPESAHLYGRYADVMLRALNVPKAAALAQEGLRYAPDDRECLAARTMCDFIQQGSKPSPALQQLLLEHPKSLRTLILVTVALEQRGQGSQAHQIAKEMLRAHPDNPHLVELVKHFRRTTHWSMLPLRPLQKYGWGASIGFWIVAVVGGRMIEKYSPQWALAFTVTVLTYVIYSWVWPPLFNKFFDK